MRARFVTGLAVIAAVSLLRPASAQAAFRPAQRASRPVLQGGVMQQLGLTPLQKRAINQMRRGRRSEQTRVNNGIKALRGELAQMYRLYPLDEARANLLIQQITGLEAQRLRLQLQNQMDLRRILTPDQFNRLNQLLQSSQGLQPGAPPPPHL